MTDWRARIWALPDLAADPLVRNLALGVVALLVAAPLLVLALSAAGLVNPPHRAAMLRTWRSWLVIAPLMILPVLLGPAWLMLAVAVLGALCHFELARATPLRGERMVHAVVLAGIAALAFAALDVWYGLFVSLAPIGVGAIAAMSILQDRPQGYLQRVALGALSFMLFGVGLSHLSFLANDRDGARIVLVVLLGVELNDVMAYVTGRAFGRRKIAPRTSPGKTLGGALGALVLTTVLVTCLAHHVFRGEPIDRVALLVPLGVIVSVLGQLGDLLLSSVKRDLGVKDLGDMLPGHGGLLDRFDSLVLVAPGVFHYLLLVRGVASDLPTRLLTHR